MENKDKASAPGLSDDFKADLKKLLDSVTGDCYIGKDPEEALAEKLRKALTRASAATVAEPGADERAAFEAACRKLADMPEESFDTSWGDDELNVMWALWKEARAAQSGQQLDSK